MIQCTSQTAVILLLGHRISKFVHLTRTEKLLSSRTSFDGKLTYFGHIKIQHRFCFIYQKFLWMANVTLMKVNDLIEFITITKVR